MSRPRRNHVQLTLDSARKPTGRGGWRPNAGRPKGRTKVAHERRERTAASHPQHVTLRIAAGVCSLRRRNLIAIVRDAIRRSQRAAFRVVHFSVQGNHLHLIIEASDATARARGLQGLQSGLARRINHQLGRRGRLFADRYHVRALRTPREVRHAIRYVLNNARHHEAERGVLLDRDWIDPCSSAAWFDGWARRIAPDTWWKRVLLAAPPPTAPPTVWLLTTGWCRHGLLRFDEVPGDRRVHEELRAR